MFLKKIHLHAVAWSLTMLCGQVAAQSVHVPDSTLRPHIVHSINASGDDVYRDDRISTRPDTSLCFLYVGRKQNGALWLRLQVRYSSYKRLDMEKIEFRKGERQLTINVMPQLYNYGDNGMITWEWYDTPPSDPEMRVIRAIIREPEVSITLYGRETITRLLSETERAAMENVLEQARILGRASE